MRILLSILVLLAITTPSSSSSNNDSPHQMIHLLRPKSGSFSGNGGGKMHNLSCLSWRLDVETHNIIGWKKVPKPCKEYVCHYMLGDQYRNDTRIVVNEAILYAESLNLTGDGKDMWVFDIDETTLLKISFRTNTTTVPGMVELYDQLYHMGFKFVFLSGRSESVRNTTVTKLKKAGYHTWEKLILRQPSDKNLTAVVYKSMRRKELEKNGYKILGNMGDQWSDLLGTNVGNRTFKVPNPMYYIS